MVAIAGVLNVGKKIQRVHQYRWLLRVLSHFEVISVKALLEWVRRCAGLRGQIFAGLVVCSYLVSIDYDH
jgi:hypothetical protein